MGLQFQSNLAQAHSYISKDSQRCCGKNIMDQYMLSERPKAKEGFKNKLWHKTYLNVLAGSFGIGPLKLLKDMSLKRENQGISQIKTMTECSRWKREGWRYYRNASFSISAKVAGNGPERLLLLSLLDLDKKNKTVYRILQLENPKKGNGKHKRKKREREPIDSLLVFPLTDIQGSSAGLKNLALVQWKGY